MTRSFTFTIDTTHVDTDDDDDSTPANIKFNQQKKLEQQKKDIVARDFGRDWRKFVNQQPNPELFFKWERKTQKACEQHIAAIKVALKPDMKTPSAAFIRALADTLKENTTILKNGPDLRNPFSLQSEPQKSILEYWERIRVYSGASQSAYLIAMLNLEKIIHSHSANYINQYSVHTLSIISIMLAAKHFDDFYYNNATYAKIAGTHLSYINELEIEFLRLINFDLMNLEKDIDKYKFWETVISEKIKKHETAETQPAANISTLAKHSVLNTSSKTTAHDNTVHPKNDTNTPAVIPS